MTVQWSSLRASQRKKGNDAHGASLPVRALTGALYVAHDHLPGTEPDPARPTLRGAHPSSSSSNSMLWSSEHPNLWIALHRYRCPPEYDARSFHCLAGGLTTRPFILAVMIHMCRRVRLSLGFSQPGSRKIAPGQTIDRTRRSQRCNSQTRDSAQSRRCYSLRREPRRNM